MTVLSCLCPKQIAKRLEWEKLLVPTEYAYRKFERNHSSRNPEYIYCLIWDYIGTIAG